MLKLGLLEVKPWPWPEEHELSLIREWRTAWAMARLQEYPHSDAGEMRLYHLFIKDPTVVFLLRYCVNTAVLLGAGRDVPLSRTTEMWWFKESSGPSQHTSQNVTGLIQTHEILSEKTLISYIPHSLQLRRYPSASYPHEHPTAYPSKASFQIPQDRTKCAFPRHPYVLILLRVLFCSIFGDTEWCHRKKAVLQKSKAYPLFTSCVALNKSL